MYKDWKHMFTTESPPVTQDHHLQYKESHNNQEQQQQKILNVHNTYLLITACMCVHACVHVCTCVCVCNVM